MTRQLLYISGRECWPTTTGAKLRDYYLMRELSRLFSVTYLGFHEGPEKVRKSPRVPGLDSVRFVLLPRPARNTMGNVLAGFVGPYPLPVMSYTSRAMRNELEELLETQRFDAVHLAAVHYYRYLESIEGCRSVPKVLLDWHNIHSELVRRYAEAARNPARRLYALRTAQLLRSLEDKLLARCDAHAVCSERERQSLASRAPGARIEVIPNGVDVEYYSEGSGRGERDDRNAVLFVGSMDYGPNIEGAVLLVREVWPVLRARHPHLRLLLVGSRPAPEVRSLAQVPGVTVTGTVEDVRSYYREASAAVVPLRVGGGTRLKIMEAMACGVPVVSTTLGAEGLGVEHGRDLLIADTAAEMAAAVASLVNDAALAGSLAEAGRALVRERYDWPISGARLRSLYGEILGRL